MKALCYVWHECYMDAYNSSEVIILSYKCFVTYAQTTRGSK
jgi:hypothetical protein